MFGKDAATMDKLTEKYVIERYKDPVRLKGYADKTMNGLTKEEQTVVDGFLHKGSVLDVGCGTGREAIALDKQGFKVTAIDISETMISVAKSLAKEKDIHFEVCDILNYQKGKFDNVIFFNNIFEQLPSKDKREASIRKSHDLLKEDGTLILTTHSIFVPGKWGMEWISWLPRIAKFYLKRLFHIPTEENSPFDLILKEENIYAHFSNPLAIKKLLKNNGFKIISINSGKSLLSNKKSIIQYLFNEPAYYICKK